MIYVFKYVNGQNKWLYFGTENAAKSFAVSEGEKLFYWSKISN